MFAAVAVVGASAVAKANGSQHTDTQIDVQRVKLSTPTATMPAEVTSERPDRVTPERATRPQAPTVAAPPKPVAPNAQPPLEQYFGVPADPEQAAVWYNDMFERGVRDCMAAQGWEYQPMAFNSDTDPNDAYFLSRDAEEQNRFTEDLTGWAGTGADCSTVAADRANPIHKLWAEFTEMQAAVYEHPTVIASRAKMASCLGLAADSELGVDDADKAAQVCPAELAEVQSVTRAAQFALEEAFIDAHRARLDDLKAQRP